MKACKSTISGKVLLSGTVILSTCIDGGFSNNVAHQYLVPPRLCLFHSLAAPPNSHIQNKVIPGCTGIEMLPSNLFCLFVVRFDWDIVLSSSYDIRKAWIHHVMSWEGTSTLLNCVWFYIKLVWIQETYPEFLVLKLKLHEVKFTT